ncbi:MAG: pyridoxine 5'-phosphate synthase [Burkholderiales bacterium]
MTRLSVNVNKVALLRNSRPLDIPSVSAISCLALKAGAQGLTVHPRPDQRHIRPDDVRVLRRLAADHAAEFNIEGNPFHALMDLVREVRPDQCTLVPDSPGALTSDHGWDLDRDAQRLRPIIQELKSLKVRVSLFMEPAENGMREAREIGADRVELYTEPYARAFGTAAEEKVLSGYAAAASAARAQGLEVNAGHDLNVENLPGFLRRVPGVQEVSIGHALIADALEFGMETSIRRYLAAIQEGTSR